MRHGPMVLGVCHAVLHGSPEVEDAFQATFLVLIRKAGTIRGRDAVGGWLHRVAHRVAVQAGRDRSRTDLPRAPGGRPLPTSSPPRGSPGRRLARPAARGARAAARAVPPAGRALLPGGKDPCAGRLRAALERGDPPPSPGRCPRPAPLPADPARRRGVRPPPWPPRWHPRRSAAVPPGWVDALARVAAGRRPAAVSAAAARLAETVGPEPARRPDPDRGERRRPCSSRPAWSPGTWSRRDRPGPTIPPGRWCRPSPRRRPPLAARGEGRAGADPHGPRARPRPRRQAVRRGQGLRLSARPAGRRRLSSPPARRRPTRSATPTDGSSSRSPTRDSRPSRSRRPGATRPSRPWPADSGRPGPPFTTADEARDLTLKLVRDDVPIVGRVVDLEGRPVPGVTVRPVCLSASPAKTSPPGRRRWPGRRTSTTGRWPSWSADLELFRWSKDSTATTGADGRFRLTGIGRERVVSLWIEGPTIATEFVNIYARTRPGPTYQPGRRSGTSPSSARSSTTARRSITPRHRRGRSKARSATRTPAGRSRGSRSGAIASPATRSAAGTTCGRPPAPTAGTAWSGCRRGAGNRITANPGPAQPYLGAGADVPGGVGPAAGHGRLRAQARRRRSAGRSPTRRRVSPCRPSSSTSSSWTTPTGPRRGGCTGERSGPAPMARSSWSACPAGAWSRRGPSRIITSSARVPTRSRGPTSTAGSRPIPTSASRSASTRSSRSIPPRTPGR